MSVGGSLNTSLICQKHLKVIHEKCSQLSIRNSGALSFIKEITETLEEITSMSISFSPRNDFRPGARVSYRVTDPFWANPTPSETTPCQGACVPAPNPISIPMSRPSNQSVWKDVWQHKCSRGWEAMGPSFKDRTKRSYHCEDKIFLFKYKEDCNRVDL